MYLNGSIIMYTLFSLLSLPGSYATPNHEHQKCISMIYSILLGLSKNKTNLPDLLHWESCIFLQNPFWNAKVSMVTSRISAKTNSKWLASQWAMICHVSSVDSFGNFGIQIDRTFILIDNFFFSPKLISRTEG